MLKRVEHIDFSDFKQIIGEGADQIARRWMEAVRVDAAVPSAKGMSESMLLDSVLSVIDEILRAIELDESVIEHEKLCSAACHGRDRARQNYEVGELVHEYHLLREHIFLYLGERLAHFAERNKDESLIIYHRVGLAADKAECETINSFVEERMEHLRNLSRTDSLTGLYNHRIFYERLDHELDRATRYSHPLSIVFIDLDNFKFVNDTKGHQFGDHLLVKCAEWLRHELRQSDIICRYGGDEFAVILPETAGEDARAMMSRLPDSFRNLGALEGAPASFGLSFGLAAHPEDNGTTIRLVQVADERLLEHKKSNKQVNTNFHYQYRS